MSRQPRLSAALALALAAGVCAALGAGPAGAYVLYRSAGGAALSWRQSCVSITAYPADLTDMLAEQVMGAAWAAADAWSADQNPGTFLVLSVSSSIAPAPQAILDRHNSLTFRRTDWCGPPARPATDGCQRDPTALALTTVFARSSDGAIIDADIEVNAEYFTWVDLDRAPLAVQQQDLQNALAHEMGHLIGLDHPCYSPGNTSGARPLDNLGNPAPDCASAPDDLREATMFPSAESGQTSKRTLAPDDQLALRDLYPADQDPMLCPPATPGPSSGCRMSGVAARDRPWAGVGLIAGLVVVLSLRRRRGAGPVDASATTATSRSGQRSRTRPGTGAR